MAQFTAQAFAQAGVGGSKPPGKFVGPKLVDQRRIMGDWTRLHSWHALLCNELESADPSWADVLDRLCKWEPHPVKEEDLYIIIGSSDRSAQSAYRNELFRVIKDRCKGTLRDALAAQQPKRSFDTLKQWLRQGQDRSVLGQREIRRRITQSERCPKLGGYQQHVAAWEREIDKLRGCGADIPDVEALLAAYRGLIPSEMISCADGEAAKRTIGSAYPGDDPMQFVTSLRTYIEQRMYDLQRGIGQAPVAGVSPGAQMPAVSPAYPVAGVDAQAAAADPEQHYWEHPEGYYDESGGWNSWNQPEQAARPIGSLGFMCGFSRPNKTVAARQVPSAPPLVVSNSYSAFSTFRVDLAPGGNRLFGSKSRAPSAV